MINVILRSIEKACCERYGLTKEQLTAQGRGNLTVSEARVLFIQFACLEVGLKPIDAVEYLGGRNPSQATRYLQKDILPVTKAFVGLFKKHFIEELKEYSEGL